MFDFDFHSPVEVLHHELFEQKKCTVYVKRDDLIHPFISGNKWRKLKYTLQRASELHKKHLITFGGAWSNHLLATAAAAAKFGFRVTAYVRGDQVENPNLQLCRLFGMQLVFIDRTAYRDRPYLFKKNHAHDEQAFFIDEGGMSDTALLGCAEIIASLTESYDHLFCACGTGTTIAGLAMGLAQQRLQTQLHGVPVLKGADFLWDHIHHLLADHTVQLTLHTDYHFGGYAKTKPALLDFIADFVPRTGLLIEPVYTGKLFYCLTDLIAKDYFAPKSRILLLHSGGIAGILGQLNKFQ